MPTLERWLTPANGPLSLVLTPVTVNATTGVTTDVTASAATLTAELDDGGLQIESKSDLRNIKSMTALRDNNVIVGVGTRVTISGLLKSAGVNNVGVLVQTYDYFKAVITRGAQVWTFYGVRESYTEDFSNEKCPYRLVLEMIDGGSSNPSYA